MNGRNLIPLLVLLCWFQSSKAEFVVTPLVMSSSSPSWLPADWEPTIGLSYASINNRGEVAILLGRAGSPTYEVALIGGPFNDPRVIAKTGDNVPGFAGDTFKSMGLPRLNNRGEILFNASLEGEGIEPGPDPPSNQDSIWLYREGTLQLVIQSGASADGVFRVFPYPYTTHLLGNNGGCFMVLNHGEQQADVTGLWKWIDGTLSPLYQVGDPLPDGTSLNTIYYWNRSSPIIAGEGMVAYGQNESGKETVWWFGSQNQYSLITQGEAIQLGSVATAIADGFASHGIIPYFCANESGEVAFHCWTSLGSAVLKAKDGRADLIMLYNETAPGTSGATFGSQFNSPIAPCINRPGQVGFLSSLMGPDVTTENDQGIWLTRNGTLELVVRKGDQAPAYPSEVHFSSLNGYQFLNSSGQMAFPVKLAGPGIDDTNDDGIWFADSNGTLEPVIMEGDTLDIGGGQTRTIDNLNEGGFWQFDFYAPNGDDGKGSPFNDRGEFLLYAKWSQPEPGAGYFVASRFRIHIIATRSFGIEITFPSRSGKSYRLFSKEKLSDPLWMAGQNAIPGLPWTTTVTLPEPDHDSFYRVFEEP